MKIKSDILLIGSGIAGLTCALKLADQFRVAIVTKKEAIETNTRYAQGGIASVFSPSDNFESHILDTLNAGAHLCNENVVEQIIRDAPKLIRELIRFGVKFTKNDNNEFDLGREGGHSQRRILHAADTTGKEIETALLKKIKKNERIKLFEFHTAIDLITSKKINPNSQDNQCLGAYVLNEFKNTIHVFEAPITILATGGGGKTYLYTSNPDIATGDGMAMAYRAGATMANLEFVQFHPTCLFNPAGWAPSAVKVKPEEKSFLISEALRGEDAKLTLSNGNSFMNQYHPEAELAPRDSVARAIDFELKKRGDNYVLLDISHKDSHFIKTRFPNIYKVCKKFGYDITKSPIPVVPAAHYFCGGVAASIEGKTDITSLYAIGETACTGLHGANRLASNSLLEGVAMADYAARAITNSFSENRVNNQRINDWNPGQAIDSNEAVVISQNWQEIRHFMWNYVGIVRSNKRLIRAKRRIQMLKEEIAEYYWNFTITRDLIELRNVADVAEMIIDCAFLRKESRGLHYNLDYPEMVESRRKDTKIKKTF